MTDVEGVGLPRDHKPLRTTALARLKRQRAVELLSEGLSYDEIARRVGFTHRGSAHRAVAQALAEREAANVDELRAVEANRLDALQAALWDSALEGDVAAATAILRIVDYRIRLFGLMPKTTATVHSDSVDATKWLVRPARDGNPEEATGPT